MASNQSTVARATFHLPLEITIEILSRLPVKSLLRFKSVCKTWYDLIETPDFISKHLQTHSTLNSTSLLVTNYNRETETHQMSLLSNDGLHNRPINLDFPFLNGRINKYTTGMGYFYIVGICNGLVCISFSPYVYPLILCNPSTRQLREIANSKLLDEMDCYGYERVKRVTFGFGFHPSANDYKLIRIVRYFSCFEEAVTLVDLYVMSTNTWTKIDANKLSVLFGEINDWGEYDIIVGSTASAVLNGVFYWSALVISTDEVIVMSFDMGDEVFRKIRTPVPLNRCFDEDIWRFVCSMDEKIWQFTELKDKLALVILSDETYLDVWVLNAADQNSWTNQFKVGSFPRISCYGRFGDNGEIRVVGCAKNGELVLTDHSGSGDLKLFSYDTETLKRTDLYFGWVPYRSACYLYTETLLSVMQTNGSIELV
ncbi:F-box/kelch-repeat protein At3g23880-like [Rhododendron vialii]|uniref:F-box/kelch-repeat protein At3g23880-like n=1 Tax=Rhododendron vialii TaxID=182163 RepID=UPI00265E04BE|nr:F-box/kelch-repeat protein At3g23880-like [Rhododendron vialii]XP_058214525.1 F-box/kelch-repeat protein At3g23880-like [Rhododendron vialii]